MLPIFTVQNEIDINRFDKQVRIDKGYFGTVYSIEDKKTHVNYAAKIIDCGDDEEQCNKIIDREIRIMIYCRHPTIIKFIGYSKIDFHHENNVTIIMELAKNGSLEDVLKNIRSSHGPINYTNTTRQIIITGIARAIKYLHDRDIIHRDLKPGNILLDENFRPHISDFGMSKICEIGHTKSQSQFGGTLIYEAPEIFENAPYDKKVDVYAFAIVMFEVVTDCFPYPELIKGELQAALLPNKVLKENYRPVFQFPVKDPLKKLIEKCWSKDPDERPTFTEIFHKLTNIKENCLLDDVDMDEFTMYVEDITEITDTIEKLLNKIEILEKKKYKIGGKK